MGAGRGVPPHQRLQPGTDVFGVVRLRPGQHRERRGPRWRRSRHRRLDEVRTEGTIVAPGRARSGPPDQVLAEQVGLQGVAPAVGAALVVLRQQLPEGVGVLPGDRRQPLLQRSLGRGAPAQRQRRMGSLERALARRPVHVASAVVTPDRLLALDQAVQQPPRRRRMPQGAEQDRDVYGERVVVRWIVQVEGRGRDLGAQEVGESPARPEELGLAVHLGHQPQQRQVLHGVQHRAHPTIDPQRAPPVPGVPRHQQHPQLCCRAALPGLGQLPEEGGQPRTRLGMVDDHHRATAPLQQLPRRRARGVPAQQPGHVAPVPTLQQPLQRQPRLARPAGAVQELDRDALAVRPEVQLFPLGDPPRERHHLPVGDQELRGHALGGRRAAQAGRQALGKLVCAEAFPRDHAEPLLQHRQRLPNDVVQAGAGVDPHQDLGPVGPVVLRAPDRQDLVLAVPEALLGDGPRDLGPLEPGFVRVRGDVDEGDAALLLRQRQLGIPVRGDVEAPGVEEDAQARALQRVGQLRAPGLVRAGVSQEDVPGVVGVGLVAAFLEPGLLLAQAIEFGPQIRPRLRQSVEQGGVAGRQAAPGIERLHQVGDDQHGRPGPIDVLHPSSRARQTLDEGAQAVDAKGRQKQPDPALAGPAFGRDHLLVEQQAQLRSGRTVADLVQGVRKLPGEQSWRRRCSFLAQGRPRQLQTLRCLAPRCRLRRGGSLHTSLEPPDRRNRRHRRGRQRLEAAANGPEVRRRVHEGQDPLVARRQQQGARQTPDQRVAPLVEAPEERQPPLRVPGRAEGRAGRVNHDERSARSSNSEPEERPQDLRDCAVGRQRSVRWVGNVGVEVEQGGVGRPGRLHAALDLVERAEQARRLLGLDDEELEPVAQDDAFDQAVDPGVGHGSPSSSSASWMPGTCFAAGCRSYQTSWLR